MVRATGPVVSHRPVVLLSFLAREARAERIRRVRLRKGQLESQLDAFLGAETRRQLAQEMSHAANRCTAPDSELAELVARLRAGRG